jgi:uncharacterized protein (DUF2147 family)
MRIARLLAFAGLLSASGAAAASPLDGLWLTDDHKGVVRIGPCSPGNVRICGWIVRVLDNRPGVPTRDVNNPLSFLRNRNLVGLPVLTGFNPSGAEYSGGSAYDPKAGRVYRSTLRLRSGNQLAITGCVLVICRTVVWTRTR